MGKEEDQNYLITVHTASRKTKNKVYVWIIRKAVSA